MTVIIPCVILQETKLKQLQKGGNLLNIIFIYQSLYQNDHTSLVFNKIIKFYHFHISVQCIISNDFQSKQKTLFILLLYTYMKKLSDKAIFFMTNQFEGPYFVQNVAHKAVDVFSDDIEKWLKQLRMVLYDGQIINGAKYFLNCESSAEMQKCQNLHEFDILKVKGTYQGQDKPILITSLQIYSTGHSQLYGHVPINLKDYLSKKIVHQQIVDLSDSQKSNSEVIVKSMCGNQTDNYDNIFESSSNHLIQPIQQKPQPQPVIQMQMQIKHTNSQVSDQSQDQILNFLKNRQNASRATRIANQKFQRYQKQNTNKPNKRVKLNQPPQSQNKFSVAKNTQSHFQFQQGSNLIQFQQKQTQKMQNNYSLRNSKDHDQDNDNGYTGIFNMDSIKTQNNEIKNYQLNTYQQQQFQTQQFRPIKLNFTDPSLPLQLQSTEKDYSVVKTPIKQGLHTNSKQCHSNKAILIKTQAQNKNQTETSIQNTFLQQQKQMIQEQTKQYKKSYNINSNQNKQKEIVSAFNNKQTISRYISKNSMTAMTTSTKKIITQYNTLSTDLYEGITNFKILCRVNYLYQFVSLKGTFCINAILMDKEGNELNCILYFDHLPSGCKQCSTIIELGMVYSFQNGSCVRNTFENARLQLIFSFKDKFKKQKKQTTQKNQNNSSTVANIFQNQSLIQQSSCQARFSVKNIINLRKVIIPPFIQEKLLSIQQVVQNTQNSQYQKQLQIYGIIHELSFKQYNQLSSQSSLSQSDQGLLKQKQRQKYNIDFFYGSNGNGNTKRTVNMNMTTSITANGTNLLKNEKNDKKIYIYGKLSDPFDRKSISFSFIIHKRCNYKVGQSKQNIAKEMGIQEGAFTIFHNFKVVQKNKAKKIEKTKRSYIQILKNTQTKNIHFPNSQVQNIHFSISQSKQYIVKLAQKFKKMLQIQSNSNLFLKQIKQEQKYYKNYSDQPYTKRTISQMNNLLDMNIQDGEECFSQILVRIDTIKKTKELELCEVCRKKKIVQLERRAVAMSFCENCKMIVRVLKIHVFSVIFADSTASFPVDILSSAQMETILNQPLNNFLNLSQDDQSDCLYLVKYNQYLVKIKSQKRVRGNYHKIVSIQATDIVNSINRLNQVKKGQKKHQIKFQTSW